MVSHFSFAGPICFHLHYLYDMSSLFFRFYDEFPHLAPELIHGVALTAKADVYPIGRLLEQMAQMQDMRDAFRSIVKSCRKRKHERRWSLPQLLKALLKLSKKYTSDPEIPQIILRRPTLHQSATKTKTIFKGKKSRRIQCCASVSMPECCITAASFLEPGMWKWPISCQYTF